MYKSSSLQIYNDLDYIDGVVEYIKTVAKKLNLNQKETNRICYAVEESLSNSIAFYFEPDSKEMIDIEINALASGMQVMIKDKGIPKNPFISAPKDVDEIANSVSLENIADESGDDISAISDFVVHKMVDKYIYKNLGSNGRSLEMDIYCEHGKIADKKDENKISTKDEKESFETIRFSKSSDATEISRIFYKTYGYTYPNDAVYYPNRLEELIYDKSLVSAIALSDKGKTIGHIALMKPYEGSKIVEWGMAISNPAFRGQGIMSKLIQVIMEKAEHLEYDGVFSHSVTNHKFTQKICLSYGFSDVAILVGYASDTLSFKKINSKLSQRETTIINFKLLKRYSSVKLYLPKRHKKIIEKLYNNFGVRILGKKSMKLPIKKKSIFEDHIISALNIAEIVLKNVGEDLVEQISITTKRICIAKVDIIYLFINLQEEEAVEKVEELEKLGYFFVGIFPYYHHEHTLVLEYINNIEFDYDKITALTPTAEELKSYIRRLDPNQVGERNV